mgnify:CR=1 FL=1
MNQEKEKGKTEIEAKAKEVVKSKKIEEILATEEEKEETEAEALIAKITTDDGIKADLELPKDFKNYVMAELMLDHQVQYHRSKESWKGALHGEQTEVKRQVDLKRYHRITIAIIQQQYPEAKAIADKLARVRAKEFEARLED